MTCLNDQNPDCKRCGRCCLADMLAYVTEEDIERWTLEGREDILKTIKEKHGVWAGDHLISAETGNPLHGCTFFALDGTQFGCSIYETRPGVCRRYQPGESELCPQFNRRLRT